MGKRSYTHVKELLPAIQEAVIEGDSFSGVMLLVIAVILLIVALFKSHTIIYKNLPQDDF